MDVTETAGQTPKDEGGGRSQSRLPRVLFWALAAAIALRVVTGLMEKDQAGKDSDASLVRWQPSETVLAAAPKAGKPILYDFTAEWCAPCHLLDREGWGDPEIAALVNESYLPARVVDRQREEGKNPAAADELQHRYSVDAFPTLVVADADGREVARTEGYAGRERLMRFLEESRGKSTTRPTATSP